jgi:pyrimidine operon attenuation protein/uracil phosphoribosyltransferase
MMSGKTQILSDKQVKQILKRLAYQVYENNFNEKELVIAGIEGRGVKVAELLCNELAEICKIKLSVTDIVLDKSNPAQKQVILSNNKLSVKEKVVVVVDDVLNTGKTMLYSLIPLVNDKARKIQTLVLVDRNHILFPVKANYVGTALSTTLQEHIEVTISKGKVNVYLS